MRVFIRGFKLSGITPSDIYRAACNEFGTVLSSKKILTEMRKQGVDTGPEFDV